MAENANPESGRSGDGKTTGIIDRFLNIIEVVGNKLPDPAVLFLLLMFLVWILSWPLSQLEFDALNPVTKQPIEVANQVSGEGIATLLTSMVKTFVNFAVLEMVPLMHFIHSSRFESAPDSGLLADAGGAKSASFPEIRPWAGFLRCSARRLNSTTLNV